MADRDNDDDIVVPVEDGGDDAAGEDAPKKRSKAAEEAAQLAEAFLEQFRMGNAGLEGAAAEEQTEAEADAPERDVPTEQPSDEPHEPRRAGSREERKRDRAREILERVDADLRRQVGELEAQLGEQKAEVDRQYQARLRLQADFENYRKRVAREKSEAALYANEELLRELLPSIDNLERAVAHAEAEGRSADPFAEGVKITLNQVLHTLAKFGVLSFDSTGKPFDPQRHEAMSQEATDAVPAGYVANEFLRGYTYRERLLRPAMVSVASGPATAATAAAPEASADAASGLGDVATDEIPADERPVEAAGPSAGAGHGDDGLEH